MNKLQIHQFACRDDNFGVLVHDQNTGRCVSIDAPEEAAILTALQQTGWKLTDIFVTHWHYDHVEGISGLKDKFQCRVVGPALEADKISELDETVKDGDTLAFGDDSVQVISTPGHTLGMVNYYFKSTKVVFCGDTLFALGCGRLFEGDGTMMWNSIQKLARLPHDTAVYCGHEYTLANGKFALSIDPDNEQLISRMAAAVALREAGQPTLPTTIGAELAANPFLRVSDRAIRAHLGMETASDAEVFTKMREAKDQA